MLQELAARGASVALVVLATVTWEGSARAQDPRERAMTLAEVLKLSRERASSAREAAAQARVADKQASAALGGYMPSASARGTGTNTWSRANLLTTRGDEVGVTDQQAYADVGATVTWTAWDSLKTPSNVASARANARAAHQRANAAALGAEAQGALAFLDVVFDDARIEVARTTVQLRERHAALAHGMVVAGIRPPVEEARVLVLLESARADLIQQESKRAQDKVELATLLQLDPTTNLTFVRPTVLPTVGDDARVASDEAMRSRPEIKAGIEEVRAREEAVSAAGAARFPQLSFTANALTSVTRTDAEPRFLQARSGTVGVIVSVPLFDWTVWARPAVERANLAVVEERRSGEVARVRGEAATAAYRTRSARALLEQARKAAEVAAATLAVVEKRYQSGLASPLELLDSGTSDAAARSQLVDAELELASATVQVLATTGRIAELER